VSIGVNHHLALATCDLLARIIASRATAIGGLHALAVEYTGGGDASRPTRSRSAMTRGWLMVSNKPVSRHRLNRRKTVLLGGRSEGKSR
jgi:hypothetical protein